MTWIKSLLAVVVFQDMRTGQQFAPAPHTNIPLTSTQLGMWPG